MKKIALATILFTVIASPAIAAESYIGVNAGQNKMDISGVQSSKSLSIFFGYAFNEYIAEELAYTDFGTADTDSSGVSLSSDVVSLTAVGSLPLNRDFSLFAKLGYATTKVQATGGLSELRGDMTVGVGAQYNASRSIGIRLGYDRYRVAESLITTKNSGLVSLGVLFRF